MISVDASPVLISKIDRGNSMFRITARPDDEALVRSIKTVGLIHAPLLLTTESGFVIVSGFKRIDACVSLGFKTITAAALKPGTSLLECARLAISDNMYQRELNGVEISHALNLLSEITSNANLLIRTAGSLGLPSDPLVMEKIRSIAQLPESLQKGIIAQRIALPVAFAIGDLGTDSANCLAQIFMDLNLSTNRQREILTLAKDISARDGISIREVLEESGLWKISYQNESDHSEIARQMRIYLKKRRFPAICTKEEAFNHYVKSLKLPRNTKLLAPDHFEGMTYRLQFSFKNPGELASCRRAFERVLNHPDTPAVFE